MPDFEKINKAIDLVLKMIFGENTPPWIPRTVGYILACALILLAIWGLLLVLSKILQLWRNEFRPLFYNPEEKRRRVRRQRFSEHIEQKIRALNSLEAWSDYRFAELEAEVEAEGRRRRFGAFPFSRNSDGGLRRERSLSKALEASQERLIILEGDPGAGKSVALRHVAQSMARAAMKARSTSATVPIYINLKELERRKHEPIDSNLIRSFILKTLNRANDRDIEEFLEEEFDRGLEAGTWLFLFDSFDELPEVLSSTEADAKIRSFGDAISDFLHGMNKCRGIIASRQFRGPGQFGWPRFRILPLSEVRRLELIRKAGLKADTEREIIGHLGLAGNEIQSMASNPMFLGLLCEHMKVGNPFPQNAHNVFETYIESRLSRDKERLQRRFKLATADIRSAAEIIAFCMAADAGLGLSPTRQSIKEATTRLGFSFGKQFDLLMDGLEYIKLARSEALATVGESKTFTFAHRRFQEYFATSIVLRESDRVPPKQLLADARWRETAVVICQTQPSHVLTPIIDESRKMLLEMVNSTSIEEAKQSQSPQPFQWPDGSIHLLSLLQAGFGNRLNELSDDMRQSAGQLINSASKTGTLSDRKGALEVAGIIPSADLLSLLRAAFASSSQWLKGVAFQQTTRMSNIPEDIARSIRHSIVFLAIEGRLRRERYSTYAHLNRLDKSKEFTPIARLLLAIPTVEICLMSCISVLHIWYLGSAIVGSAAILMLIFIDLLAWYNSFSPSPKSDGILRFSMILRMLIPIPILVADRTVPMIVTAYLIAWFPFALLAAYSGQFTRIAMWPFIPFWPFLYMMKGLRDDPKGLIDELRTNWESLSWLPLLLFLSLSSYFDSLFNFLSEQFPKFFGVIKWGYFIFIGVSGIGMPILIIPPIYYWCRDGVRWRRWSLTHQMEIRGEELFSLLNQYRSKSFCIRLFKTVREQNLLVASEETEILMEKLITSLENHTLRKDFLIPRAIYIDPDFLDEACRLLEQVRANRAYKPESAGVSV